MALPIEIIQEATASHTEFLEELNTFLRIPSVSTLPENEEDTQYAAEWLANYLTQIGIEQVTLFEVDTHPILYGEWLHQPGKPTVLIYGHYDVQPADPLDQWISPPFEPTVRGDNLYARGSSDMKASMLACFKALGILIKNNALPVNLKFLIEGAEEIGSLCLDDFIEAHKDLLKSDVVVNCDAGIFSPEQPSISYALRGLVYFEIEVFGPKQDLHSGMFGGTIHNPAQALCELIAGMHDDQGRVTLPGYYDKVRPLDQEEREDLARLPMTEEAWQSITGAPALCGEAGYTFIERVGARPTLEVNGFLSGFTGTGAKTVLPEKAMAKISMRIVPDQDPADIHGQLLAYMEQHAPKTIKWTVRELSRGPAGVMDRHSPAMQAAIQAQRDVFHVEPIFKREGGSVPVVALLQQRLGIDSIMLGFGLPDDCIHGPNEKQHIPSLLKGLEVYLRFFDLYGQQ